MTLPPCCLLTLDLIGPGLQSFIFALGFFLIVTENVTPHVCAFVYCACVCFILIWGYFVQKENSWAEVPGEKPSFHTGLDVFYGNLVNFSLYLFHKTIYT